MHCSSSCNGFKFKYSRFCSFVASVLEWGDHTGAVYSRWGLTSAKYALDLACLDERWRLRLSRLSILVALIQAILVALEVVPG